MKITIPVFILATIFFIAALYLVEISPIGSMEVENITRALVRLI